jgi:mannose-6-phosphate isomerase-like protein (cupin superfamily)
MSKASSSTGTAKDFGVAVDRTTVVDGYSISFVSIRQTHDLGPILASLPAGHCTCPHWGYVLKGKITIRYSDREETVTAGEAFYMPPGHAPAAEAGTELIQFSPADQLAEVEQAIMAATQPGSTP